MKLISSSTKIWVAGHRGLLGSAVKRSLERHGYKNLVLRTSQELDLTDQRATYAFLESERPEAVVLCAAKVGGIHANHQGLAEFMYLNLQMQNNAIEGARRFGVKRLLFVGSSCIFPKDTPVPIREEQLLTGSLEPTNEGYALAKIAGIKMCEFYRRQYGCDFISAIPTNLYGVNDNYDLLGAHVLPALIHKIHLAKIKGETEVELWGSGRPRREFMFSDDCADALVFLLERYQGFAPINVGSGEDISILELANEIASVLGAKVSFRFDASKPDGVFRKVLNISKLQAMGWTARRSFREGLAEAYADFCKRYA